MAPQRASPLMMLLGAVFFFSANVFAASAVLGVDLGTEFIKAALVKPGIPLEIVLTKDSRRKETSAVAFKPVKGTSKAGQFPEREYGADAIALAARFPGEVYPNLKTLLGLPIDDPIVQEYASRHPALQLEAQPIRNTASFKSKTFESDEDAWTVEELLAMELQSIQKNAELAAGDGSTVRSVVITVPPFYTTEEKRAVQLAADLAGLKVLSLISDGLAVGLNYATSRQFPNINEGAKPEYHLVFDMGAGSTIATIMKFQSRTVKDVGKYNKTVQEVQVLGSGWDRSLGGDSLNYLIMDDLISQFVESKGALKISATAEGVKTHGRAMAKIIKESERLRHVLSANQNTQASFEGLYEDVDFKYKITRTEFESLAAAHADRVGVVVNDAVKAAGLDIDDLTSVILHGGATRTPFVQKALEQIIGSSEKLRSNVNADEAAVFGAGFRAAELSPSFRVKEIRITDGPMYPTGLKWVNANGKSQRQRLWTVTSALGGVPKEMTFAEENDFSGAFYQQIGGEDKDVTAFTTKNLTATIAALKEKYPSCVDSGVQFKVGFKLASENGEPQIAKAVVECEAEVTEKEGFVDGVKNLFGFGKKDKNGEADEKDEEAEGSEETLKKDAKSSSKSKSKSSKSSKTSKSSKSSKSSSTSSATGSASSAASGSATESAAETPSGEAKEVKRKQIVTIPVDVVLEKSGVPELSKTDLANIKDRLKAFAGSDKARHQREEALNQLEGYTYKVRDLVEAESFIAKSTEKERTKITKLADEASEWLYEEGTDAPKEEFKKKLKAIQDIVIPIQKRVEEDAQRPALVSSLKDTLNQTTSFLAGIRKQISEYEEWQVSSSASAAESSKTSTATAETPTGDFDGLEDDSESASAERTVEDIEKEQGPVPPLYKPEDIDEVEALHKSTLEWLNEKLAKQDALGPTDDPVLLVKDLKAKRDLVDKAGMDLAMKGIKHFDKTKPKKTNKNKSSKTKSAADSARTIKIDSEDGKLSDEQLQEMLAKIMAEQKQDKAETENEELEHDEL